MSPATTRLGVAEAEQEAPATRPRYRPQVLGVSVAVIIAEDVEKPAVQDGIEGLPEIGQVPRIVAEDPRDQTAVARFAPGGLQRARSEVDAGGVQPETGRHEGVLAGSAACVHHPAPDQARPGEAIERGLGAADVPRRPADVQVVGPCGCPGAGVRVSHSGPSWPVLGEYPGSVRT